MEVADEQEAVVVDVGQLTTLAEAVLIDRGIRAGILSLSFVDLDTMADLNERFLGGAGPTDVLAFPLDAGIGVEALGDMPVLLGDVVVCPAVAEGNATARSVSTDDELALLVVHGVLHVLGMDHAEADEAAAMQDLERHLLARMHRRDGP
ncbi:MAG TPA: rRNA maturation RNase YbeY [Acidimicrobiales bacterium]|nr:rRNA maturation RNase YbeY [Acidimicrobiales bacterium]